jgi:DNA polymerase-1
VVTGDRDELQLLNEHTSVYYTKRGISDIKTYTPAVFAEEYAGLAPQQLIDLKGLMGDASDNIPGVQGVGPKTALKLICQYGSVENVLAHVDEVAGKSLKAKLTEHKDSALLSKKLATICLTAPVDLELAKYQLQGVKAEAETLLHDLEFRNLYARFAALLGNPGRKIAFANVQDDNGKTGAQTENGNGNSVGATKNADGNLFNLAVNANATGAGENKNASGEGDLFSMFGNTEPAAPAEKIIATAAEAQAILEPLAAGQQEIWILATESGTLPDLHFGSVAVCAGAQAYTLEGEALPVFTSWLGTAACPKGTLDSKTLYRVALSQKVQPRNLADDVSIAAYLDNPGQTDYTLKKLIETYLIGELPATVTALSKVAAALKEQLGFKHLTALYRDLELPLVPVLAQMELAGVTVDAELLENKDKEFALKLANLEAQAKKEAGDENFNPQSPKQLGAILFEKLQLPVIKKTKTGYSTDVSVLEQLAGQHPLVDTILQYRILAKLYSTYLEGLKPLLNKTTGRVHTHFQQLVTVTGRLSSTDPNLQNIPTRTEIGRGIRELFVPGVGYDYLMSCDYSQIELRILAHIAQDPLLIESFRTGQDVHARTAAEVFGLPLEQVTPELRGRAKAVNFGIVYGISDFGLAKQIGSSRKEAAQFIESYFARYQGVKKYMEQSVELARTQGYVTTLLGRRRYLPDIRSSNFNRRNFAERTAMNTPIQGTAADIMKLAMLKVDAALKAAGVKSRVLLQVHDELILEVTAAEKEQVGALVQKAMMEAFKLDVPLLAAVTFGRNWAEAAE